MSDSHIRFYASSNGIQIKEAISAKSTLMWSNPIIRQRLCDSHTGENNARAVLTDVDVRQIRLDWSVCDVTKRGATKQFCVLVTNKFGVTSENIFGIIKRKSWKHLP